MATSKVTFTLDQATLRRLEQAAARLGLPKSAVVREAILELHERIGQLSERERVAMLQAFDDLIPKIPPRNEAAVDAELAELRRLRKSGGRRSGSRRVR